MKVQTTGSIIIILFLLLVLLAACQSRVVETVTEVEVTRVVTETVFEEGETVEVTRVVTEVQEVVVEATPEFTAAEPSTEPVTLHWNWGAEPPSLDPALATDTTSIDAATNLYMGLTRPDPVTGEVLPYLATEWEVSEDGTVYTFNMRQDIQWVKYNPIAGEWNQEVDEEGNPRFVNAHDVVYGVKRTIDPETASTYAYVLYNIANARPVNEGEEGVTLDDVGVEALEDFTVQFTLEQPAAYFTSIAGMWVANPQPQWAIEEHGNRWTEPGFIVTNGPMGLEEWIHGGSLNLVKNPLWPEADSVQIERVEGVIIGEASTAFAMYENNELDATNVPLAEMDRVKADKVLGSELVNSPIPCTIFNGFVNNKPPVDDVRVRRAFVQAIDRQSLVDNVTKGGEIPATTFAPPGIFGAPEPGTVGLPYDASAAQASLQEYLDENGLTLEDFNALSVTLMHPTSEGAATIAAAIQQMWKDNLGVDVKVENQEWKVYLDTINKTTPIEEVPHMYSIGWCADYADENNWVHEVFNAAAGANSLRRNCVDANCSESTTSEFDEITAAAAAETDPDKRIELYAEAERILAAEEAAYMPLYHNASAIVVKPWLTRNFPLLGGNDFFAWTIDQEAQLVARGG